MSALGFTSGDAARFHAALRHALVTCRWSPRAFAVSVVRWNEGSLLVRVLWSLLDGSTVHDQGRTIVFGPSADEFDACLWAADLHETCVREQRLPWSVPK